MSTMFACSKALKTPNSSKHSKESTNISNSKLAANKRNKSDSELLNKYDNLASYEIAESKNNNVSSSNKMSSGSRSSSYGSSYYPDEGTTPPSLLSEKDKSQMQSKLEKDQKVLRENAIKWLNAKINDSKFSQQTIEKYKIKANQSFVNGSVAFKNKQYNVAIKNFNDVLKDKEASPVTKYFALSNLMNIAMETKDFELYFIAARMNAALCATEDLSVLGIEKSTHQLEWVEKVENSIRAKKDQKYFDKCVQAKLDFYRGGIDQEEAIEETKRDIVVYTEIYKELIE